MKNTAITIKTYYHSLVIERQKSAFYLYNDRNGEHCIIPFDVVSKLFKDHTVNGDGSEVVRMLSKFFTYEQCFNMNELVKLFQSEELEIKFYRLLANFNNCLEIKSHSDHSLLCESLIYKKEGFLL